MALIEAWAMVGATTLREPSCSHPSRTPISIPLTTNRGTPTGVVAGVVVSGQIDQGRVPEPPHCAVGGEPRPGAQQGYEPGKQVTAPTELFTEGEKAIDANGQCHSEQELRGDEQSRIGRKLLAGAVGKLPDGREARVERIDRQTDDQRQTVSATGPNPAATTYDHGGLRKPASVEGSTLEPTAHDIRAHGWRPHQQRSDREDSRPEV
jgi:hypothetical protein